MERHAHLVGSIGLADAHAVFATVADILGPACRRIPDGETGERGYWIRWQIKTFQNCPDLEADEPKQLEGYKDGLKRTLFRLREGANPESLALGELGYAAAAADSYALFTRLAEEGKIPDDVRFQVSLPTPMALVCGFVAQADRLAVEPAVNRAMAAEVERIQAEIPAERLAIQWDVCHEVLGSDGGPSLPYDPPIEGSLERLERLCGQVNEGVELGIHLCYGDPGHKHIVEPGSLAACVELANGICHASPRPVDYIHMPVPRDRGDDAYFKPLDALALPAGTQLVLGLVHYTDGVAGTRQRIAAAQRYVASFDIATECGFGRRDPATIPDLLRIHRELCG